MSSKLNRRALAALLVLAVVAFACGGSEEDTTAEAAMQAEFESIQQLKLELDGLRQQYAELAAAEAEPTGGEDASGDEPAGGEAAPGMSAERLEAQIGSAFEALQAAIGRYFAEVDPLIEGDPPNERHLALLRVNSDEAMINAREHIRQGGDYRQAINIYNTALLADPDNEKLVAALAEADAMRYMTEERFSVVKNGMKQSEVHALIGIPHYANRRNFEDERVVAWYYPVDPQGSAAAVYFQAKGDDLVVYKHNFEEVVKDGPSEAGG